MRSTALLTLAIAIGAFVFAVAGCGTSPMAAPPITDSAVADPDATDAVSPRDAVPSDANASSDVSRADSNAPRDAGSCQTNADCGPGRACYIERGSGCGPPTMVAFGVCVTRLNATCTEGVGSGCPCLDLSPLGPDPCPANIGAACWGGDQGAGCWWCNTPQ